jgi:hypothetical protein
MKRIILASILTVAVLVAIVPISNAEMAREGTSAGTYIYTATSTVAPLDKERYALIYETLGVNISDTGKGPFHNMSGQNIGVIYFDKGVGKVLAYMIFTAPDGDKVLVDMKEDKALPAPNINKGTGKFLGGTGKFAGIEGTVEYTRYYVKPVKKGTVQAVAHIKFHWKLPETKK